MVDLPLRKENSMLEFQNSTLSQKISEAIAIQIAEGTLKPGERLLENDLMGQFGTSRAPIRESLFLLEKDGIVERVPRRGVFVKTYTKKELIDLYETVYSLLEIALKKIMETATEQQLMSFGDLVAKMEKTLAGREIKKFYKYVEEFHLKIFILSNNDVLKDLYLKMNNQLMPFRYISLSHPSSLEYSVAEYKQILLGLVQKDLEQVWMNVQKKQKRALLILEKVVVSNRSSIFEENSFI